MPRLTNTRAMRFIPAGAGNTLCRDAGPALRAVHPRRRGEHFRQLANGGGDSGSSPQARGTRLVLLLRHAGQRFIPAGAGNTRRPAAPAPPDTVHPRRRGEHGFVQGGVEEVAGSSPQARGTLDVAEAGRAADRFIPAGAGNTFSNAFCVLRNAVHPRRRGEHAVRHTRYTVHAGSSPQARGTHQAQPAIDAHVRFIPAGAGNTCSRMTAPRLSSVHPRRRGEHTGPMAYSLPGSGSSPQARGTRVPNTSLGAGAWFIPAGAGNT